MWSPYVKEDDGYDFDSIDIILRWCLKKWTSLVKK